MNENAILKSIEKEIQTGVVVIDRNSKIIYANPFFVRYFSREKKPAVLRGKRLDAIMEENDLLEAVTVFLKNKRGKTEGNIEINANQRFFKVRIASLEEEESNVALFLQDITEEKRVEAIKKDFVANVSHELRTPLASIKGYAETLLSGGMEEKKTLKEFLRIIDRHATRMSLLIDDLLTLSKIESHEIPLAIEPLDICALIRPIVAGFNKQAKDKRIKLLVSFDERLPKVMVDRIRLEQVMVNLLDNAIKYTPSGGSVSTIVSWEQGEVMVRVRDTGIGIPQSDMPRIFERFYRVDKARSREVGGTGLGLAIVKHIIQGLKGRVWVESSVGKGSTFGFTLKGASLRK